MHVRPYNGSGTYIRQDTTGAYIDVHAWRALYTWIYEVIVKERALISNVES